MAYSSDAGELRNRKCSSFCVLQHFVVIGLDKVLFYTMTEQK